MSQTICIVVYLMFCAFAAKLTILLFRRIRIHYSIYEFHALMLKSSVLLQYREELRMSALWSTKLLVAGLIDFAVHKWHHLTMALIIGNVCAALSTRLEIFLVHHRRLRPLSFRYLLNYLEI
jgi:hypothetical protein